MNRKDFLRIFLKVFFIFFILGPLSKVNSLFAAPKKNKKGDKKTKSKKRKSRKSKRRKGSKGPRRKRFKYKRGGPDIRVITKDSQFSDVPDNGVMPVERQQIVDGVLPSELGE